VTFSLFFGCGVDFGIGVGFCAENFTVIFREIELKNPRKFSRKFQAIPIQKTSPIQKRKEIKLETFFFLQFSIHFFVEQ
jgi:hypothetical protein